MPVIFRPRRRGPAMVVAPGARMRPYRRGPRLRFGFFLLILTLGVLIYFLYRSST